MSASANVLLRIALIVLLAASPGAAASNTQPRERAMIVLEQSDPPTVGTEGQLDVLLPFDDLIPAAADVKADLIVRIAEHRTWGTGTRYDLRYIASTPGEHNVIAALRHADGRTPSLPPLMVSSTGLLDESHDGSLTGLANGAGRQFPWYGWVAAIVMTVWLLLLVPFILTGRKRADAAVVVEAQAPTLADRLRPLVEAAARGDLDADGRSQLERLLLHVWRCRLEPAPISSAATLRQLKKHPKTGPLLRALENWMHRRPGEAGADPQEITRLLEPYRYLSDDESMEIRDQSLAATKAGSFA